MKRETFSTQETAEILGRNSRFIFDWVERGLVIADVQAGAGPGTRMQFSYAAVLRAYLALHFQSKYGFSRKKLQDLMESLWGADFFQQWALGFPEDKPLIEFWKELQKAHNEATLESGGSLFIINPHKDNCKVYYFSCSIAIELEINKDLVDELKGIDDIIAVNLVTLESDIRSKIERLK
jgi:hypothetical protein